MEKKGLDLKRGIILGIAAAILFTLPVTFRIFTSIPGKYSDTYQVISRSLMVKNNLEGMGITETVKWQLDNDFWGIIPIIGYTQALLGQNLGYNLWWMLSFFLAFLGAWCFARELTKSSWAAGAAGFVFAFSPFHISQAISTNIGTMHYEWLVWLAFFLFLFWKKMSWKSALGSVFSFFMIILTEHQLLAFTLLFLVIYIPFLFFLYPKILLKWKFWLISLIGAAAVMIIGYAQFEGLLKISASQNNFLIPDFNQVENYSADLVDFVVPARFQTFLGEGFNDYREDLASNDDGRQSFYLGYSVILLGLIGLIFNLGKKRSRRWVIFWFLTGTVFAVLSLGPTLHWMGKEYFKEKMPYMLVYNYVPFWDHIRTVSRIFLVSLLGWSMLSAWGVKTLEDAYRRVYPREGEHRKKFMLLILDFLEESNLLKRKGRFYSKDLKRRMGGAAMAVHSRGDKDISPVAKVMGKASFFLIIFFFIFMVFEYTHIPIAKTDLSHSTFYDELAEEEGNFAILEIPGSTSYDFASHSLYIQSIHQKHLINGMDFARVQSSRWEFQRSTPVIYELLYSLPTGGDGQGGGDIINEDYSHLSRSVLDYYNIRYVTVSKEYATEDRDFNPEAYGKTLGYIENNLGLEGYYEDEYIKVYRVPELEKREGYFLTVDTTGDYWGKKEGKRESRARWAKSGAKLGLVNLSEEPINLTIYFEGKIKYIRKVRILYDGTPVKTLLLDEYKGEYSLQLTDVLPGDHIIEFEIRDGKGNLVEEYDLDRGVRLSHFRTAQ